MKKAVILSIEPDLEELRSLLDTLGVAVQKEFVQKLDRPHTTSFLGPGKIEDVHREIEGLGVDIVVVNGVLRPSQHHFLEMKFQMECMDRPGVILRIFANHAHSPEAIAQVTLAKLRYEQPFLREWIHKAKSGDRPGFLAGGAYATDVYYEHAKTHARRIEKSLRELMERRETTRSRRRERGYSVVSLAGHTNVGKSALLNKLSGANVEVDDRMFSTLSTTTRRLLGSDDHVLLTDTVGFIRNLPPDLIDAFNSTLEEIFQADLVLLLFDISEEEGVMRTKLSSSIDILTPDVGSKDLVLVGNKVDLLSKEARGKVVSFVRRHFGERELYLVSAKTGEGLDELKSRILQVQDYSHQIDADVPLTDEVYGFLSRLRSIARVQERLDGPRIVVRILCRPVDRQKLEARIIALGGTVGATRSALTEEGQTRKEAPEETKGSLSRRGRSTA